MIRRYYSIRKRIYEYKIGNKKTTQMTVGRRSNPAHAMQPTENRFEPESDEIYCYSSYLTQSEMGSKTSEKVNPQCSAAYWKSHVTIPRVWCKSVIFLSIITAHYSAGKTGLIFITPCIQTAVKINLITAKVCGGYSSIPPPTYIHYMHCLQEDPNQTNIHTSYGDFNCRLRLNG